MSIIKAVVSTKVKMVWYTTVMAECITCHKDFTVTLPKEHWDARADLTRNVQEIAPTLSDSQRELLFKTGICGACWDVLWVYDPEADAEEEEEEEDPETSDFLNNHGQGPIPEEKEAASICKHCETEIVHYSGRLWHAVGEKVFPQYCLNTQQLHEPQPKEGDKDYVANLLEIIGSDKAQFELGYCAQHNPLPKSGLIYTDWEKQTAEPALRELGYTVLYWFTGDGDSFGPLTRVVVVEKDGIKSSLMYG